MRRVLKPDGIFVMYNFFRQDWIVERIAAMVEVDVRLPPDRAEPALREAGQGSAAQQLYNDHCRLQPAHRRCVCQAPGFLARFGAARQSVDRRVYRRPRDAAVGQCPQAGADRPFGGGLRRQGAVRHRRLAVSLPARPADPGFHLAVDGDPRGSRGRHGLSVPAQGPVRPQQPDVLPRRRLHAARNQGRRADGAAVRQHMGGQFGRVLHDIGADPLGQPLCSQGIEDKSSRGTISGWC